MAAVGLMASSAFAASSDVPLYTNKDLEKFRTPAPKTSSAPVRTITAEEYKFIQTFIDTQYARLDAERERSNAQRESERSGNTSGLYMAPYGGYYGYPYNSYDHYRVDPNASNIYRHGFGNPDGFPAHYARPSARFRDGFGGGKHGGGGRGH